MKMNYREDLLKEMSPAKVVQLFILLFVLAFLVSRAFHKKQKYAPGVPIAKRSDETIGAARERFRHDARSMLSEGYRKYKGQPFYIPTPLGERLQIPEKYVDELKSGPMDLLDFPATFFEMFEGRWSTMGDRSQLHPYITRTNLTANIPNLLPHLEDEISDCFDTIFPDGSEWTSISLPDPMTTMVARISSRMFGGLDLSRNTAWIDACLGFAHDGFVGAQYIKKFPRPIHPLVAPFVKAFRGIKCHHATARKVVCPIVAERHKDDSQHQAKPIDALQWMMDEARGEERDPEFIASLMLKLSFASIHTSSATPVQVIYDLCAMPEYIAPLREEIDRVMTEEGGYSKGALAKLVLLDSFMAESQRFNPLLLITFERLVREDYTLKDGFVIPANTQIGCPCQAVSMDDAFVEGDPSKFDGFRYHKLRMSGGPEAARYQWSASNLRAMSFGYGRHACPGRYFAAAEVKMILVYFLQNFDFKYSDGRTERPPSWGIETQNLPDPAIMVSLRRRSDAETKSTQ